MKAQSRTNIRHLVASVGQSLCNPFVGTCQHPQGWGVLSQTFQELKFFPVIPTWKLYCIAGKVWKPWSETWTHPNAKYLAPIFNSHFSRNFLQPHRQSQVTTAPTPSIYLRPEVLWKEQPHPSSIIHPTPFFQPGCLCCAKTIPESREPARSGPGAAPMWLHKHMGAEIEQHRPEAGSPSTPIQTPPPTAAHAPSNTTSP